MNVVPTAPPGKTAAQARFADHAQGAIHQVGQAQANGQAQAGSGHHIVVACGLVERFENKRLVLMGYPLPVSDLPLQTHPLAFAAEHLDPQHHAPGVGELDGIAQQVVEDLPQSADIPSNGSGSCGSRQAYSCKPLLCAAAA